MLDVRGRVLLTGATGFLGPYVSAALSADGWTIRSALRSPAPKISGETAIIGAIGPKTDWSAALRDVDVVVHLAARAHRRAATQLAERDEYFAINAEGTARLAAQAQTVGVKKFVFMSSIAVNGSNSRSGTQFTENDIPRPSTIYGESKAAAEDALRLLSDRTGLRVTVVRPPMIYGRRAKGSFRMLARAVSMGIPLPFACIHNRRAFVAAENLADFLKWELASARNGYERFIVTDREHVSTSEFIEAVGTALRRPARLFPLPPRLLRWGMLMARYPDLLDSTLGSLEVNPNKVRAAGWQPPFTMDEALVGALEEYKEKLIEG